MVFCKGVADSPDKCLSNAPYYLTFFRSDNLLKLGLVGLDKEAT